MMLLKSKKTLYLLSFLFGCFAITSSAQVVYFQEPMNHQVVARDLLTNEGQVKWDFSIKSNLNINKLYIQTYRDSIYFSTDTLYATYFSDSALINFQKTIPAELHNYGFKLMGIRNGSLADTLLKEYNSIVAGDVYVFAGQSNGEAEISYGSAAYAKSDFIRTFGRGNIYEGDALYWYTAEPDSGYFFIGGIGQLAGQFAKKLMDTLQIPMCIINGCKGGATLQEQLVDSLNPTSPLSIYQKLKLRLEYTGLSKSVRAMIWFHGEQDAYNGTTVDLYKSQMNQLAASWEIDYPNIENIYVFQLKLGCLGSENYLKHLIVQEAQRLFSISNPKAILISTNNVAQYNSCHYQVDGYERHANKLFKLVLSHQYNFKLQEIETPQPILARNDQRGNIILKFGNSIENYSVSEDIEDAFILEGGAFEITSALLYKNTLTLRYVTKQGSLDIPTSLSYKSHIQLSYPFLQNKGELNLACFYKFPIENYVKISDEVEVNIYTLRDKPSITIIETKNNPIVFRIHSMEGRLYKKIAIEKNTRLSVNNNELPKGIYIATTEEKGVLKNIKFENF